MDCVAIKEFLKTEDISTGHLKADRFIPGQQPITPHTTQLETV